MQVGMAEARERLPEMVERAGLGEKVELTRRGEVVAMLVVPRTEPEKVPFMQFVADLRDRYGVEDWPDEDVFADVRDKSAGPPPIW